MSDTNSPPVDAAEAPPAAEKPRGRGFSLWFLAVPIALALAGAALAFFLLAPKKSELMTTPDSHAVAVAVANSKPAPTAYQRVPTAPR